MEAFDENFESVRLNLLAQQFPEIVKFEGGVEFYAEDDEDRLSGASWEIDDEIYETMNCSGFKLFLIEALDTFIQYRSLHNQLPRKQGVVQIGQGSITIEWNH